MRRLTEQVADRLHATQLCTFALCAPWSRHPWGQQPTEFVRTYRMVASIIYSYTRQAAMMWAPSDGCGYPYVDQKFGYCGKPDAPVDCDGDGDGQITQQDVFVPYWPGSEYVDFVGMSLFYTKLKEPWGTNVVPAPDRYQSAVRA